jgi:hypothetical protein
MRAGHLLNGYALAMAEKRQRARKAAIDKGRTPSYLSIIPAATRKSAVSVGTSMHDRAAESRVRFKKAWHPLRSLAQIGTVSALTGRTGASTSS